MNPTAEALAPPPQPPQPHRPTSCDRHPEEHFTGFCPLCLCERLADLDPSSSSSASALASARKPPIPIPTSSTAASALKAIFKPSAGVGGGGGSGSGSKSSFFPELRRTKSFSASKNEGFSGIFEPQRKSCDVRVRNTLWSLFTLDDERNPAKKDPVGAQIEVETGNLASSSSVRGPVFESKEEEESQTETETENDIDDENADTIRVQDEPNIVTHASNNTIIEDRVQEIEEEVIVSSGQVQDDDLKTMKDHIDLDSQTKRRDFKEIAGSFWSAASVFSKKLQKWRQKQKLKKRRNDGGSSATLPVEKPIGRQYRETQSEIADYGFGRRSCDTDPRFSLDAARISFDDPRYSFDEPRASWDGYLIGRTFPRMPTMVSVVEDAPVHVSRSDTQIPVEEPMNSINEGETVPGGSAQTRDYYSDSSSRRRRSLDRSNSIRKTAAAVVAEIDEMKSGSNAKVSPATADSIPGPKLDRELRDSNSNWLRDDCSETFEMPFRDNASVVGNGERKAGSGSGSKKSSRWSKAWSIWGLIHRRSVNKDEDEDRFSSRPNGVERSFSESWQDLRGERNGETKGGFNPKVMRSNSSVSWRNAHGFGGTMFGNLRKNNGVETNGNGKKRRDEFVLERNRSARYSPNNIENGLLRFYLTPLRSSSRRGVGGSGKNRTNHAHSIARSVLRLY